MGIKYIFKEALSTHSNFMIPLFRSFYFQSASLFIRVHNNEFYLNTPEEKCIEIIHTMYIFISERDISLCIKQLNITGELAPISKKELPGHVSFIL